MNANDLSKARNPDVHTTLGALRRAAQTACKTVMQTNTHLVIMNDGRVQRIVAAELVLQEAAEIPPI